MPALIQRSKSQRGNAALELALVLLPLMALLFAIVDFALPVFLRSVFSHAVREGARYGITYRVEPGMTHSQSIRQIVQRNAAGWLNGTSGLSHIDVKYYLPVDPFNEATGPNANIGGNIVEVSISGYEWSWIAPIWRWQGSINVGARSSDRLESLPRGVTRPAP